MKKAKKRRIIFMSDPEPPKKYFTTRYTEPPPITTAIINPNGFVPPRSAKEANSSNINSKTDTIVVIKPLTIVNKISAMMMKGFLTIISFLCFRCKIV